ncbi:hypothetical protein ANO14919_006670 [Xylariales sp. No.14919]|nr:hypothetical protein ANO14919_006670 [Xylariales sp. No.14919]
MWWNPTQYPTKSDEICEMVIDVDGGHELKAVEAAIMKTGNVYIAPRGVRHRPVAKNAQILSIGRNDTVNKCLG